MNHLKMINELVLYAGISCLVAFFTRQNPVFFYPIFLLRIAIISYCWFVMPRTPLAFVIIIALMLGWIGGYWDSIEGYFHAETTKTP